MKYTPIVVTVLVMLIRFTFVMAQTSDCQKKCEAAFIVCSGKCAKSTDTACGAACIKEKDACVKNCAAVKPKPVPKPDEKKSDAKRTEPKDEDADADDEADIDDDMDMEDGEDMEDDEDMDLEDEPDDAEDESDAPDTDEEDL